MLSWDHGPGSFLYGLLTCVLTVIALIRCNRLHIGQLGHQLRYHRAITDFSTNTKDQPYPVGLSHLPPHVRGVHAGFLQLYSCARLLEITRFYSLLTIFLSDSALLK